jgi:hypothetical protein
MHTAKKKEKKLRKEKSRYGNCYGRTQTMVHHPRHSAATLGHEFPPVAVALAITGKRWPKLLRWRFFPFLYFNSSMKPGRPFSDRLASFSQHLQIYQQHSVFGAFQSVVRISAN